MSRLEYKCNKCFRRRLTCRLSDVWDYSSTLYRSGKRRRRCSAFFFHRTGKTLYGTFFHFAPVNLRLVSRRTPGFCVIKVTTTSWCDGWTISAGKDHQTEGYETLEWLAWVWSATTVWGRHSNYNDISYITGISILLLRILVLQWHRSDHNAFIDTRHHNQQSGSMYCRSFRSVNTHCSSLEGLNYVRIWGTGIN